MLGLSLASAGRCQVHVPRRGPPLGRGRSALGRGWAIGLWVPPGCRPARCPELVVGAAEPKRAAGSWAREEQAAPSGHSEAPPAPGPTLRPLERRHDAGPGPRP